MLRIVLDAVALVKHVLFFVGNIKTGSKNLPKAHLKGIAKKREDKESMKVIVPGMENKLTKEVSDSIHQESQLMVFVHTTGCLTLGPQRLKRWAKY